MPMPPAAPGAAGPGAEHAPAIGLLQQSWVQNALPFVTSITAHAVLIILMLVVFKVVVQNAPRVLNREQTIVPDGGIADVGVPGGPLNAGVDNDQFRHAMQDAILDGGKADGIASKAGPTLKLAEPGGGSGEGDPSPSIVMGVGGLGSGKGVGGGNGKESGNGAGDGSGPLAMFGAPGGGAIGTGGIIFGLDRGNARHIVFVCDATGSMLNKMASLEAELQDAVQGLKPIQSFNIIFYFDGGKTQAVDTNELLAANPENKRRAYRFLESVTPTGQTDPIPALRMAFRQQPDLIYLLSDGGLDDNLRSNKEITDEIDRLNAGRKVKVNTILFDGYAEEAERVMAQVAKDNGGKYRYVKESDLNNR